MSYPDAEAAALYDLLSAWDPERTRSDAFYHELVMSARDVLDVGCGTGSMLHHARVSGHTGRLVGLDPDEAMLDRARRRTDIEWVLGRAADARWEGEFDLATMTSHAFQCLVRDDDLRESLGAVRQALRRGGRFAFETRHPQAREWEEWSRTGGRDVVDASGRAVRVSYEVEAVDGDIVTFTESTASLDGTVLRVDRASLRFLAPDPLVGFLLQAGFEVEAMYGDWDRVPIDTSSTEIVVIARLP